MKQTVNYNEAYIASSLIEDLSALELPAKALTEKLLARIAYGKPVRDFEEIKKSVNDDEKADAETKTKVITEKATEEVPGFTPKGFSAEAFEQIVEAAVTVGNIPSRLAAPQLNEDGEAIALGTLPAEIWLEAFAENLVEI